MLDGQLLLAAGRKTGPKVRVSVVGMVCPSGLARTSGTRRGAGPPPRIRRLRGGDVGLWALPRKPGCAEHEESGTGGTGRTTEGRGRWVRAPLSRARAHVLSHHDAAAGERRRGCARSRGESRTGAHHLGRQLLQPQRSCPGVHGRSRCSHALLDGGRVRRDRAAGAGATPEPSAHDRDRGRDVERALCLLQVDDMRTRTIRTYRGDEEGTR